MAGRRFIWKHFPGMSASRRIEIDAGVMQGLLHLAGKHPVAELEQAACVATHHGTWRLRDLKRLLELPGNVTQLDFLETHPLIRSLEAYHIEPTETLQPN